MVEKKEKSKLERWSRGFSETTRQMIDSVLQDIAPLIENFGFVRAEYMFTNEKAAIPMGEVVFERKVDSFMDYIHVAFDKSGKPKLQVYFYRRDLNKAGEILRSASLVKTKGQYLYFWGKPWWMPLWLYNRSKVNDCISTLARLFPQVLSFLESGDRGSNVGLEV